MKIKKSIVCCFVLFLFFLYVYKAKTTEETPEPLIPMKSFTVVAQQKDCETMYFCAADLTIPQFFSYMPLQKTNIVVLAPWRYKAVVMDGPVYDDSGKLQALDNNSGIITVYDEYIEINGITYLPSEGSDLVGWFDIYWENNVNNYELFTP